MDSRERSRDFPKAIECESIEEGQTKLMEMAEAKLKDLKRPVLIVIAGEPNSGKTYLSQKLRDASSNLENFYQRLIPLTGVEKLREGNSGSELIKRRHPDFICIEEVGPREGVDRKLERTLDQKSDLFVFIYHPERTTSDVVASEMKTADLIIKNSQAKVKGSLHN